MHRLILHTKGKVNLIITDNFIRIRIQIITQGLLTLIDNFTPLLNLLKWIANRLSNHQTKIPKNSSFVKTFQFSIRMAFH